MTIHRASRYNTFDRIKNAGAPIPLQAQNVHAIHFDDQMSGYRVHGNLISNSWAGIKLGGGRRTIVRRLYCACSSSLKRVFATVLPLPALSHAMRLQITNNTFVHTHHAIEFDNRGETWQKANCDPAQANGNPHSFFQELWQDFNASDEWAVQFPCLFCRNIYPCLSLSLCVCVCLSFSVRLFLPLVRARVLQMASRSRYLAKIAGDHPCVPVYNVIQGNTYCKCDTWITATAAQITSWHSTAEANVNVSNC